MSRFGSVNTCSEISQMVLILKVLVRNLIHTRIKANLFSPPVIKKPERVEFLYFFFILEPF